MKKHATSTAIPTYALKAEALASMLASFERFCLAAGLETLSEMLEQVATAGCGERHERGKRHQARRWGRTKGKIGFHGGKVEIERPRVRGLDGAECVPPGWENAVCEDLLDKSAMNQMLINVPTRRFKRSVRLPEGDVPASGGSGLSKSATSRRFGTLSAARMKAWMEARPDDLDLLAIQIDGIHLDENILLVAAIGVDANGDKHPHGLVEGATENAMTVQALIDNLVERELDPTVRRLFIVDGAKALSKTIRRTFGRDMAIQRCQIHEARSILERLPKSMHASVRRVLRQAWEMDGAETAETLIRNLARRLERDWNGVSASILEGIDEMLTLTRLGLPRELQRSLACNNIIENLMGPVRRVCYSAFHLLRNANRTAKHALFAGARKRSRRALYILIALSGSTILVMAQQHQPASVSTIQTSNPQEFDLLDKTGAWAPIGTIDPLSHLFTLTSGVGGLPGLTKNVTSSGFPGMDSEQAMFRGSSMPSRTPLPPTPWCRSSTTWARLRVTSRPLSAQASASSRSWIRTFQHCTGTSIRCRRSMSRPPVFLPSTSNRQHRPQAGQRRFRAVDMGFAFAELRHHQRQQSHFAADWSGNRLGDGRGNRRYVRR